jgi:hypothetical protein
MEHNLLVPSAPQWFLFSRFTSIPPETLERGFIDRHTLVKFNSDEVSLGFKIPKRYRSHRAEKVGEMYPFMRYLEAQGGPEARKEYITFTGLDSEFFLDFDNLINFQLFADTIQYFIRQGLDTVEVIRMIVQNGQDKIYWDHYGVEWKKLRTPREVLLEYANEQVFFQADFQLRVEQQDNALTVYYLPEYHLRQFKDINEGLVSFLNEYRRQTLSSLLERVLGTPVKIEQRIEAQSQGLAARFQVSV